MFKSMQPRITGFVTRYPKATLAIALICTIILVAQFPKIKVDTDPENMLSEDAFVRKFHHEVKREFGLYDFIILGIVNEDHPAGVFNKATLGKIHEITEGIKDIEGVIPYDIIAPSTVDNISQGGVGQIRFEWLMRRAPVSEAAALYVGAEAKDNPMLDGILVSQDGKALCIYVPIEKKDMSYRVSQEIRSLLSRQSGDEKYYITGLPIAEDTFGVEMFKQMAISAPLAGLIIFALMWLFFRRIPLIVSPMIVALLSVICTMGLLIAGGFTVHIMSSMIPIFLMPIAVVDSIHILSEFFDRYKAIGDKRRALSETMETLFTPMLYTSITTTVGFASLAITPIPPVQVFGVFVAIGVMLAWLFTVTLVPACMMLIKDKTLEGLGAHHDESSSLYGRVLKFIHTVSTRHWKRVLSVTLLVIAVSVFGISRIQINDNPVKWFVKDHPIRVADTVLNKHFGGTYTGYLVLEGPKGVFNDPDVLNYIEGLQQHLGKNKVVGKTAAITDLVKKVYYELMGGDKAYNVIPSTKQAIAQCLIAFQNSHKPDDLWHLVTPDYSKANIWVLLKSGDNRDMNAVVEDVSGYMLENPAPHDLSADWAGLTYINVVWQNEMVFGMLKSLLGSFIIVFLIMVFLFRSFLWGALSMIPLSITITFIYGLIGIVGKDYDMPVAILSSLTLGLSIDFAIHFLERTRELYKKEGSWKAAAALLFEEPARAISKNTLIIAIGFLPLLVSTLVPYRTVGVFMAAIMLISGLGTLFILPAVITPLQGLLFRSKNVKKEAGI